MSSNYHVPGDDSGFGFWFIMIGTAVLSPFVPFYFAWLLFGWPGVWVTLGALALFCWRSDWFREGLKTHPFMTSLQVWIATFALVFFGGLLLGANPHQEHPNLFKDQAQHTVAKK